MNNPFAANSTDGNIPVLPQISHTVRHLDPKITLVEAASNRLFLVEPEEVHANILWLHGLTDHPGRHFQTAVKLAEWGFRSVLFELRGHGGGEFPVEASLPIYTAYGEDAGSSQVLSRLQNLNSQLPDFHQRQYRRLRSTVAAEHLDQAEAVMMEAPASGKPWFLFGFSMGGLLAALLSHQISGEFSENLRGLILMSPAFKPKGRPGNLAENLFIDGIWAMRRIPFAPPRFVVKNSLRFNFELDCQWGAPWMSDQRDEVALYASDPLVLPSIPSGYAGSIESLMARIDPWIDSLQRNVLFLFPGVDGITSLQGGLEAAERIAKRQGAERCRIEQFPDIPAHDLLRSSVGHKVFGNLLEWLQQRL